MTAAMQEVRRGVVVGRKVAESGQDSFLPTIELPWRARVNVGASSLRKVRVDS